MLHELLHSRSAVRMDYQVLFSETTEDLLGKYMDDA